MRYLHGFIYILTHNLYSHIYGPVKAPRLHDAVKSGQETFRFHSAPNT